MRLPTLATFPPAPRVDPGSQRHRRMRVVGIVLVAIVGCAGAGLAWVQAERVAQSRREATADATAVAVRSAADTVVAGLAGSGALVRADGTVPVTAFDAYARDIVSSSALDVVASVAVVSGEERAAFEQAHGVPITSRSGEALVPAADAERYWPIQFVRPAGTVGDALVGLDLYADRLTHDPAMQAIAEDRPIATGSVDIGGTGSVFFLLRPVFRPGEPVSTPAERQAAHAGFVATAFQGDHLVDTVVDGIADPVRLAITEDAQSIGSTATAPDEAIDRPITVAGRSWTVWVEDLRSTDHRLTWFLLAIALVLTAGLAYLAWRSMRHEAAVQRGTGLVGSTADLAQQLATAATTDEVASVISEWVPPVFHAFGASLGTVDQAERVVRMQYGTSMVRDFAEPYGTIALDAQLPVTAAIAGGEQVLIERSSHLRAHAAAPAADHLIGLGTEAAALLPLRDADGEVMWVVGIVWRAPRRFDSTDIDALRTITELCEQTLIRSSQTDVRAARAADLADLAESIAGAVTVSQTASVITDLGRLPVGAAAASIGLTDVAAGVVRVLHGADVADGVASRFGAPPIEARLVITDAARTGQPVLIEDFDQYLVHYPEGAASTRVLGEGARAALPLRDGADVIGSIVFSWLGPKSFDNETVSTLSTIAEMAAQAIQRARLTERQSSDAERTLELAALTQQLAVSLDTDEIIPVLVEGLVRAVGAQDATVALVRGDQVRRHIRSELRTAAPDAASAMEVTQLDERTPLTDAVRTGTEVVVSGRAHLIEQYPHLADAWDAAGFETTANVAMRDRTGRIFGGIGIGWSGTVEFDDELHGRLDTIVRIAAQTLERTQLVDLLRLSAQLNDQLADVAQRVARSSTVDELCGVIEARGAEPVQATVAAIGLLGELEEGASGGSGEWLVASPHPLLDQQVTGTNHPASVAVRAGSPVLVASVAAATAQFGKAYGDAMVEAGLQMTAHLPLASRLGESFGVLAIGWGERSELGSGSVAMMRTLAELCAQTLEQVRLTEAEHQLVGSLQSQIVTALPEAPGLQIAQRYLPAANQVGMGGDWADGLVLDDHRYVVVVGDVAGHGINAVADMMQVKTIIAALIRTGVDLVDVFPRVSEMLSRPGASTATALIAVIDLEASTLSYVAAGHPQPILRLPDGSTEVLSGGRQSLLGVPIVAEDPGVAPFPPGSFVLGYTDGLIERRGTPINESVANLGRVFGEVLEQSTEVEGAVDAVIGRCLGADPAEDDIAVVVVGRP